MSDEVLTRLVLCLSLRLAGAYCDTLKRFEVPECPSTPRFWMGHECVGGVFKEKVKVGSGNGQGTATED